MTRFAKTVVVLAFLAVVAFLLLGASFFAFAARLAGGSGYVNEGKPHLVLLKVDGPILGSEKYLASVARIARSQGAKGVLLRIDSPGGAVGSSQEIYSALKRLRQSKGLPVVVSYGNVAASGGYYISLAGQRIFSNPGTLTGSIGVIFQFPEAQDLFKKLGVDMATVKSGRFKDVGSPFRKPNGEDMAYLQGVIDNTYGQFVDDVLANRKITRERLLAIADGRVLTGAQALAAGLVDTLGGLDEAKRYLAQKAQLPEDAPWVEEPPPKSWVDNFMDNSESRFAGLVPGLAPMLRPGLLYLWK